MCVIFSSSGSLRMRLISQFSRASGARFSETDDSPETVVGRWILPAKLKALLGSSTILSQVVPGKDLMVESKSPLFGITPLADSSSLPSIQLVQNTPQLRSVHLVPRSCRDHAATRSRRRSSLPHDMKARKAAERSWPSPSFNVAQNAASPLNYCAQSQNRGFRRVWRSRLRGDPI